MLNYIFTENMKIPSTIYIGDLAYADDATIICPNIRGMKQMFEICNTFAE